MSRVLVKTRSSEGNQESYLLWNGRSVPKRKMCTKSLEELYSSKAEFDSSVVSFWGCFNVAYRIFTQNINLMKGQNARGKGEDNYSTAFILGSSKEEFWHLQSLLTITIISKREICKKAGRANFSSLQRFIKGCPLMEGQGAKGQQHLC